MPSALDFTLHGSLDALRVIAFDSAGDGETAARAASEAAARARVGILVAERHLICPRSAVKGAHSIMRSLGMSDRGAARPLSVLDIPLLQSAITGWMSRCFVQHGGFLPLADGGLLLDARALDAAPRNHDALGAYENAAAIRVLSVEIDSAEAPAQPVPPVDDFDLFGEHSFDAAPSPAPAPLVGQTLTMRLHLHLEAHALRQGTVGFRPLSVLCAAARAELEKNGMVDLGSPRLWHKYDPEGLASITDDPLGVARLLPDLRPVRLLSVHASPPTSGEHSATDAPRTAAAFRQQWGERFGIWLSDSAAAGPYATCRANTYPYEWYTVPMACLWPTAAIKEVREPSAFAAAAQPCLARAVAALNAHAPLDGLRLAIDPAAAAALLAPPRPTRHLSAAVRAEEPGHRYGGLQTASGKLLRAVAPAAPQHAPCDDGASEVTPHFLSNLQSRRVVAPASPPRRTATDSAEDALEDSPPPPFTFHPVSPTPVPAWARKAGAGKRPLSTPPCAAPRGGGGRAGSGLSLLALPTPARPTTSPLPSIGTPSKKARVSGAGASTLPPLAAPPLAALPPTGGSGSATAYETEAELNELRLPQLKERCKARDLRVGGTKGDLIARLLGQAAAPPAPVAFSPFAPPPAPKIAAPKPAPAPALVHAHPHAPAPAPPPITPPKAAASAPAARKPPAPKPPASKLPASRSGAPPPGAVLPSTLPSWSSPATQVSKVPRRRVTFAPEIVGAVREVRYKDAAPGKIYAPYPTTARTASSARATASAPASESAAPSSSATPASPRRRSKERRRAPPPPPPVVWPGDARTDWLVEGTAAPSEGARAFTLGVARAYGEPRDGMLSIDALNAINRVLGAEEAMDNACETYLLGFNKGRFPAPARALCAEGYAEYVAAEANSDFDDMLTDMRKLHAALVRS